jgi:hypothetical protein
LKEVAMKMIGESRENWLCFLDQNGDYTFLVLVEEEPARRAHALYREGRVLEAAQALDEAVAVAYEVPEELWDDLVDAVPDMAWRAKGFPLDKDQVINERPGEAVILLSGGSREAKEMPLGVFSGAGWDHEGRAEFHYTLFLNERLLATEPIEGLPKREERPE